MRLVFVTRAYWPALGGQENYLRHLATGLADRHEVTVLAQTNSSDTNLSGRLAGLLRHYPTFEPYRDGGVSIRQLRVPRGRRPLLLPALLMVVRPFSRYAFTRPAREVLARLYRAATGRQLLRELAGSDVIHMWGADVLGSATLKAARRLSTPVVITPFAHPGQHGDDPFSASIYRHADRVIGLLDCDADLYGRLGVDDARLAVVPRAARPSPGLWATCGPSTPWQAPSCSSRGSPAIQGTERSLGSPRAHRR